MAQEILNNGVISGSTPGWEAILNNNTSNLLNYIKTSCGETEYLARYPEEWNTTVEQEEAWVNRS